MGKNKLQRFAENNILPNVFQPVFKDTKESGFALKNNWLEQYFGNENPITLELGCGRGEYTVELARRFPDRNFIGVDVKGARLWRGAKTAHEEGLKNVAFLRVRIDQIANFFGTEDKISDLWFTFPDPQLRESKESKRLTSPKFLKRYSAFLPKENKIHLKTDSRELYDYTLETIQAAGYPIYRKSTDVDSDHPTDPLLTEIKTTYERLFREHGKKINYLEFNYLHE